MTEAIEYERAEALGISREAYDEVIDIVGRIPTMDELSTLLAMWEATGRQKSLYGWLRGQQHSISRDDYIYDGNADHKAIDEPRVKDCIGIAQQLCANSHWVIGGNDTSAKGGLLYMVGNVSSEFADSEYGRRCLHLADSPVSYGNHDEDCQYTEMIMQAMSDAGITQPCMPIAYGGLFCSLLQYTAPHGYDILAPREVRLDAFLFGEERGRYLTTVSEKNDDQFLLKLDEAGLNCCFLGRITDRRIVVDGYDFGPVSRYLQQRTDGEICQ